MRSGVKSYMRNGSLIQYLRKFTNQSHMTLQPIPLNILIYLENFLFFFISVGTRRQTEKQTAVRHTSRQVVDCHKQQNAWPTVNNMYGRQATTQQVHKHRGSQTQKKISIERNSSSWTIGRSKHLCYPQPERAPSLPFFQFVYSVQQVQTCLCQLTRELGWNKLQRKRP